MSTRRAAPARIRGTVAVDAVGAIGYLCEVMPVYRDEYPHEFEVEEAVARLHALTDYWDAQYNTSTEWEGSTGVISGVVLGLGFEARFHVGPGRLHGSLRVSRLAVAMGGRGYLKRKLDHYMDPRVPLPELVALVPARMAPA